MKRLLLITIGLIALSLGAARAEQPAVKPAATVLSVLGKPKVSLDEGKTFKIVVLGQSIAVGSLLRTGLGKLTLLLSEGSVVHLASNTELTLKAHNPADDGGGTVFGLAKGFARFIVAKLQPGRHFEVATANAVAAVKGTDFEAGIGDDGNTDVNVFESKTKGSVELSDIDKIKSILIGENGSGSYDGKDFKSGKLDPSAVEKLLEHYQGLNAANPTGGDKADKGDKSEQQQGTDDMKALFDVKDNKDDKDQKQKVDAIVADTLQQFFDQQTTENKLDSMTQKDDIAEFKVVIDHNGDQTLVTQSTVISDDNSTISNATVANRNSGANQGSSYVTEVTQWNQPLPDHWAPVVHRALNDPANLDASGYPVYYRTVESMLAGNPYGDTLEIQTAWHTPDICVQCGNTVEQGLSQTYFANSLLVGTMDVAAIYDIDQHTSSFGVNHQCQACSDNMYMNYSDNESTGGVDFTYTSSYKETWISESLTLHDDNGVIFPTMGMGITNPNDYRTDALSGAYNTSVVFNAPNFTHPIDVIFLSGYFSTFDLIQMPTDYSINTCEGPC